MTYVDGFLVAVPSANREAYRRHAETALTLFKEFGVTRMVEGWGDDVPRGTRNDMWGAVQAGADETVLFSWCEYPDKATRQSAGERMMTDERMKDMGEMPFDGKRMVYSGFEVLHEAGGGGQAGYIDGVVLPVPTDRRADYAAFCRTSADAFIAAGALRTVDCWGEDLPEGKVTDFHRAVLREEGETVAIGWIEWADRAARDRAWEGLMQDERLTGADRPFDGGRMIFGGFVPIVDR